MNANQPNRHRTNDAEIREAVFQLMERYISAQDALHFAVSGFFDAAGVHDRELSEAELQPLIDAVNKSIAAAQTFNQPMLFTLHAQ